LLQQNFWLKQQKIHLLSNFVAVTKPLFSVFWVSLVLQAEQAKGAKPNVI